MAGVTTLLTEASAAGLTVELRDGKLVVRGPRAAESIAKRLLAHKAEVVPILRGWDAAAARLICWFDSAKPPSKSFRLKPGITISDPARYWRGLRMEIAAGPRGARNHYGAVQADLQRLHELMSPGRGPA